jgi:hypothetical protein
LQLAMSEVTRTLCAIEGCDPHAAEQLLPLLSARPCGQVRFKVVDARGQVTDEDVKVIRQAVSCNDSPSIKKAAQDWSETCQTTPQHKQEPNGRT